MIYVVGQTVGREGSAEYLADLAGVDPRELLAYSVWIELDAHPGTLPIRYVRMIERAAEPGDLIVLLGRRVAREFRLDHLRPLAVIERNGGRGPAIMALPTPTARNRWYRDPDHSEDARITLRGLFRRYAR